MSSDEDHENVAPVKKRRVQRACDSCRRKKRACDGLRTSEKKCTHCIENGLECTFAGAEMKRRSYVDVLESRLELTEALLRKFTPEVGRPAASSSSTPHADASSGDNALPRRGPGVELAALTIRSMHAPEHADDELAYVSLTQDLQDLSINQHRERFHGDSSGAMLVKAAVLARQGYEQKQIPWHSRRMHYWTYDPAKDKVPRLGPLEFPEADLLASLVGLYFEHQNIYLPLLHRPTFERNIADRLHEHDSSFGAVVLLVCAIGARFSSDERVCPPGAEPLRVGWDFFDQVSLWMDVFSRPTIYHLQFYCLATAFLEHSTPAACWSLIGMGIRLAQDIGAHRRQNSGARAKPTAEGELLKRAFWVLVCMDREVSAAMGRPCTTQYEDFDVELPLEVDDEYWENADPALAFKQPPGKPSSIALFNCLIRLSNIFGFGLNLMYGLNKARALLAHRDSAWEEHILHELDSALRAWVDAVPAHLRWDPDRPDSVFFDQSVWLYCSYNEVQMTIHRPRLSGGGAESGMQSNTLPSSFAICTNAARSTSHLVDTSRQRKNGTPVPILLSPSFFAGLILLLNVWGAKRTGLPPHLNSAMFEVHKCMAAIRVCEKRWQAAGLYWDLLYELASISDLPLPRSSASPPSNPSDPDSTSQSVPQKRPRHEAESDSKVPEANSMRPQPSKDTSSNADGSSVVSTPAISTPVDLGPDVFGANMPAHSAYPDSAVGELFYDNSGNAGASSHAHTWPGTQTFTPAFDYTTAAAGISQPPFSFGFGFGETSEIAHPHKLDPGVGLEGSGWPTPDLFTNQSSRDTGQSIPPAGGENAPLLEEIGMWAGAPIGFKIDEWASYFSAISESQHGVNSDTPAKRRST